ncbi:hypothetical protein [Paenibacillus sp. IHBB 10380]|uniref:hypothetical protein n=1 Tax=Paenibacillus sp. IHBB 10380 TaxID=1566358 RepID=UPI0005CFD441|nr:hypothetical protein [Paenibacillus sp. IHBB 10380]AJS57455.1 nucleoside-diphosphate sugar epimerase [Paenibacillus sp. IHBB 10380]
MQAKVDQIITHLSHSQQQMARILDAERHVVVHIAQIIHDLPDPNPELEEIEPLIENSVQINKSIICYMESLADLQEALAENLSHVVRELCHHEEE